MPKLLVERRSIVEITSSLQKNDDDFMVRGLHKMLLVVHNKFYETIPSRHAAILKHGGYKNNLKFRRGYCFGIENTIYGYVAEEVFLFPCFAKF